MGMGVNLDLSAEHRSIVTALLEEHLPGTTVWAYGSRVAWTARHNSDLDLVVFATPEQEPQVGALREALQESDLPFRVDLHTWTQLPESFKKEIETEHVTFAKQTVCSPRRHVPLGRLVRNLDSRRVPLSARARSTISGRYPYYGATGILDYIDDYLFEGLHLLVAEDGSVETPKGNPVVQLVDGQFWVNNHAHVLCGPTDAETRYLYYALSTVAIRPFVSGSVQAKLSQRSLNRIPIAYPVRESERLAIARILSSLDDRIELNRRMNETLEATARALFKSWFVDFDPVRAKMEGRDTGLPPEIADLFPERLVESESGQAPEGWATFGMRDVAELHKNTMDPQLLVDEEVEHFSIPAFDTSRMPTVQTGRSIRSNKTIVPINAILLSKLNPETSRVWIPHGPRGVAQLCSTEFLAFTPRKHVSRSLLYGLFTSRGFRSLLLGMVTGTSKSHQRVQPHALARTGVLTGTAALFDCYDRMISGLLESVPRRRLQTQRLGDVRDTLLPKLVAGEIRLPTALVSEAA